MKTTALLGSFLLFALSCVAQSPRTSWPMINGDAQRSSYTEMDLTFPLVVTHTFNIGYNQENGMAISDDRIFIAEYAQDSNRLVIADRNTGSFQLSFPVPNSGGGMLFIPAVAEGVVLIGGQNGRGLYALDVETGDSLWLLPTGSCYTRSPVISEGRGYQMSFDSLSCFDLHTGEIFWSFSESMPQTSPTVDHERVYFNSRAHFYALDRITGDTAWVNDSVSVGTFQSVSIDTQFVFTGNIDQIAALNKANGEVAWIRDLDDGQSLMEWPGAFAVTPDHLLVKYMSDTSANNQYLILDKSTGDVIHRIEGTAWTWSSPTIVNENIVEYSNGTLTFISIADGHVSYEMTNLPVGGYAVQVIAADNKIYLAGSGPNVVVLESATSAREDNLFITPLTLFPNPISDNLTTSFDLTAASTIIAQVLDDGGRIVVQHDLGYFGPGRHLVKIPVARLIHGTYFLRISGRDFIGTGRFVSMR